MFNESFLQTMVALCPDAIIGTNRQGIVTFFNETAEKLTDLTLNEVLNTLHVTQLYDPPELSREVKRRLYSPEQGGVGRLKNFEVALKNRGGRSIPIMLSAIILQEKNKEIGSIGYFHDLTQTRQLEKISITDELTGLSNRYHFQSTLVKEIQRSIRYDRPLTLFYFDLDNFKPFNDNFGHSRGDDILRFVAKCAKQWMRVQDEGFRLGGDEFALLLIETDLANGVLVAERFRRFFNEQWLEVMSKLEQKLTPLSLSIGVAQYCKEDIRNRRENLDNFVKRADMAMYEAKRAGGNSVVKAKTFIGKSQNTKL